MNPTLLLNATAYSKAAEALPSPAAEDHGNNQLPLERDVAWQRALENAQEGDLAGMFSPWRPDTGTTMLGQNASGDAAMRQTAVAMTVGVASPSVLTASIAPEAAASPDTKQMSPPPSPPDAAAPPNPAIPHSLDAHSEPYAPAAPLIAGVAGTRAGAPTGNAGSPSGGVGLAPRAPRPALPGPGVPGGLDSHSQPYAPEVPLVASAVGSGAAAAGTKAGTTSGENRLAAPANGATAVVDPASGATPETQGGTTKGTTAATATSVQPAATLAGALASALEAALPVAVTAMSSAAAIVSGAAPASARPAAMPGAGESLAAPESAAEGVLAGDLEEEASTDVPDAAGTSASGYVDRGSEAEAREPVRLYAEWSEQGVSVWLGTDANQEIASLGPGEPGAAMARRAGRTAAGGGLQRARRAVGYGNRAGGRTRHRHADDRGPHGLPASSQTIASDRY